MTRAERILLVDDEVSIQRAVAPLLRSRGYEVDVASTGADAMRLSGERPPDLIVLDLGLPDIEGTEICRRIRTQSAVPIIVLSARGAEADKVAALELGADDYITKPFGPEELVARIRVALRRTAAAETAASGRLVAGDLTIDYDRRRVLRGRDEIRLTPKEFELLSLLAKNADRVMTHRAILKAIWGPNAVDQPEHLWVLIGQLRKKIESDGERPRYIVSEPWVGYRFETDSADRDILTMKGRHIVLRSLGSRAAGACAAAVLIVVAAGCRNAPITSLEHLVEARRLAADMLVQFTKNVDAGNRAVMADTDETSTEFVREANAAAEAVAADRAALGAVLRDLEYADEARLLDEFDRRFGEYRALDTSILGLAVENTNLKAQRLSFGPVQQEADAIRDALAGLASARPDQALRMQILAATTLAAVREIQAIQAPHIAESDEVAMDRLEKRASDAQAAARGALESLATVVRPAEKPRLALATAAFGRFVDLNTQVVTLSRRNSNVRSLALSLGQKRTLTAACEESLRALHDALANRGFTGTR